MEHDIKKALDALEQRVKLLESLKKPNSNMFGRSYNLVGDSSSDFLIKTKGQVKILWGNVFINLIKDGKLNVDADFIFKSAKVGQKDGIYILPDGTVWIKVSGSEPIPLVGNEIGTTYVSFMGELETTSEMKHLALVNIGFLYPSLSDVTSSAIKSGIIYVESESKLYIVQDGVLSEFKIDFPNPFTQQFIIAKSDASKGALYIKGSGVENSLAFDLAWIYPDTDNFILESNLSILFKLLDIDILELTDGAAKFGVKIESEHIQSPRATLSSGYRLYVINGESTLEVDNLIVRNLDDSEISPVYPELWILEKNVILSCILQTESSGSGEEIPPSDDSDDDGLEVSEFDIELAYKSSFLVGNILYVYKKESKKSENEEGETITSMSITPIQLEVLEVADELNISVRSDISLTNDDLLLLTGALVFLVKREGSNPIRIKDNNVDIVEYGEDLENPTIKARFGDLTDLSLKETDGGSEVDVEGSGTYSENGIFKHAAYSSEYELSDDDDSSKLASTEWVRKLLSDIMSRIESLEEKMNTVEGNVSSLEGRVTALETAGT